MLPDQENPVTDLDQTESWDLLAGSDLGRLAVSVGDQPEIFPINYLAHDGVVLFCTAQGSKLVNLTINRRVALEIDGYTDEYAWSVIVHGTARTLESGTEIEAAAQLPMHSWIPTLKYVFVEIAPQKITGRRFALGPAPERW
ncbi:pyridoxamine 5'-phosphate oxidase family protein [Arthrobacter sp. I2-34]|uniref:Pyridoxamine 5'-phosphate oxidase family protein n=1 Tax=Arthrobacter hankyongi TaxID=2904801 RepID=A0ABS9L709_9MICC|nr:pyridoxamine 5'-phosphate oxidase family protein [Arthrobacter hankyongi]MCG2622452.1 pyridoxamine 5'-phosphate oxidase family protein [Arthrobacter hankyongi]